jgi:hypothetical protein
LICKKYSQVEGIDFEDIFSLVARMEEIRMFLAFHAHENFKFYQTNFKLAFLNGDLEEKLYIEQLDGF